MNRRYKIAALVGSALVIAILSLLLLRHREAPPSGQAASRAAPSYWYDPMHAERHFDKPGKSPFMDMQLVPKYADGASDGGGAAANSIAIDSRLVQTLGIRLASVDRSRFARGVDTVGLVTVDEHGIQAIQVREPGWV